MRSSWSAFNTNILLVINVWTWVAAILPCLRCNFSQHHGKLRTQAKFWWVWERLQWGINQPTLDAINLNFMKGAAKESAKFLLFCYFTCEKRKYLSGASVPIRLSLRPFWLTTGSCVLAYFRCLVQVFVVRADLGYPTCQRGRFT